MPRLPRTILAIGAAACMAAAFAAAMTAPASAQTTTSAPVTITAPFAGAALTSAVTLHTAAASSQDCANGVGYTGLEGFWRCTGTSATSPWVGSSCAPGEYNAGSYYNVYLAVNFCAYRVWLHEYKYPADVNNGWAVCVSPYLDSGYELSLNAGYQHPENIMVSNNTAAC